ncbi:MAG: YkvA family protein [Prosthecobacter sp.]|nr:YkvA family protein [Prosthecobacter sp.]
MASPENQHDVEIAKVTRRAQDIENKLPKLKKLMQQAKVILALVKDYWSGRYREVPYWVISAGALTLLYVLNPLDVIPDIVPGFGYLDDATLVAFCLKLIERELEKYEAWAAAHSPGKAKKDGKVMGV